MLEKNEHLNLTAVRAHDEAYLRHVEDALAVYGLFDFSGKSLIDVGSGGGLPGIPLRLQDPTIRLTLLDATAKKVAFLQSVCEELGLGDVACIAARAEEQARLPGFREAFDVAIARGLAYMPVLCELCLPFVKLGGFFLAMKGAEASQEIEAAQDAQGTMGAMGGIGTLGIMDTLGGKMRHVLPYPLGDRQHTLVVVEKVAHTPPSYPRKWAAITRSKRLHL
ncbi:MAG: 16S rRNA (guanine(527)-N(7))-methyltransferase RsmG [Oscillospiraceae bacterium]|nr:16S rRNA (guanine(527)-N(7))-methyltransferase RsmG [Oscillospiraceae bacterium]